MPQRGRYGKKPARLNSVKLRVRDYYDHKAVLPAVPPNFGHAGDVPAWGMLGNDICGCCVWSGGDHETMLDTAEGSVEAIFTEANAIGDYSAVTDYDPAQTDPDTGENPTDQGTDVQVAAKYRQQIGLIDSSGTRHKVAAYLALTPGDPDELAVAAYVFSAVGIGIRVPDFAEQQFEQGQPWSTRGQYGAPNIVGGHYVPVIGRQDGMFQVVTWGQVQLMDEMFYRQFCDEAIVYLSLEFLNAAGKSPEGFNVAQLQADLQAFTGRAPALQ